MSLLGRDKHHLSTKTPNTQDKKPYSRHRQKTLTTARKAAQPMKKHLHLT